MDSRTTSADVLKALEAQGLTLATAESCTGGGIGQALTGVPGSSRVYRGGIISYTNEVKMALLQVPSEILEELGAVSGAVAEAMAKGAAKATGAEVAVSTTGLAGPGGDDFGNPVGTVWIGLWVKGRAESRKFLFIGDRESIREQAVEAALQMALKAVRE